MVHRNDVLYLNIKWVFPAIPVVTDNLEIRKVQAYSGDRSLLIVLPKIFSEKLRIEKGDFLKCHVEHNRLIVQKLDADDGET